MTTTRTITNAFITRTLPDIFYEDPERIEDDMEQWPAVFRLSGMLFERYEDRPDVFVSGGGFIMYNRENGNQRVAPDCYIAFDVDERAILENLPNFWIWETGKAPDFAMEVASPSTASNDLGHKRDLYERLGIAEYWRFDATGGELYGQPLAGERLVEDEYLPYALHIGDDGSVRAYSELLDVVFLLGWARVRCARSCNRQDDRKARGRTRGPTCRARSPPAAEARERALLEEVERLRQQQAGR